MNHLLRHLGRVLPLAALPVALLTACGGNDDDNPAPAPDQGRIQAVHAAPYNKVKIDLVVDDRKAGEADYTKATGYQAFNTGNRAVKIKVSSSQADVFPALAQTVEKDKRYTVYVYNPTAATVGSLVLTDDQTAPATAKANVRFVNLGFNAGNITLLPQGAGAQPLASNIAYGQASPSYTSVDARAYTLEARQAGGLNSTLTSRAVTFEAGKIYTVLLRGREGVAVAPDEALALDVIANN